MKTKLATLTTLALGLWGSAAWATTPRCPNVMLLLDHSGSMVDLPSADGSAQECIQHNNGSFSCPSGVSGTCYDLGNQVDFCVEPGSKISGARQVIQSVLLGGNGVAAPDPHIRFGFSDFPADQDGTYCDVYASNVPIDCDYGTAQTIVNTVNALAPLGSTPTGPALRALLNDPQMKAATGRNRYVVLVTDGQPTCGDDPTGTNGADAIQAVKDLKAASIQTFVVGFGTVTGNAGAVHTLQAMAAAGSTQANGQPGAYFPAADAASLSTALSSILSRATGELGGGGCDDSCVGQGCPSGQRCDTSGAAPACVADPCAGTTCAANEFCRSDEGSAVCVAGCGPGCPAGQACIDSQCLPDNCAGGTCATCGAGQAPDVNGTCVANQCGHIACPVSAPLCTYNNCHASTPRTTTSSGSTGGGSTGGSTTGGSTGSRPANGNISSAGCGCEHSGGDVAAEVLGLGLLAAGLRSRRRRS
jgi:hypothetical protein